MADSFADLTRKMSQVGEYLTGGRLRDITNVVALAAKKDAEQELEKDLGGDRKFSNWKPKLGVGFNVTGDSTAEVKPRPSGPWSVLDGGRKPGARVPKKGKSGPRHIKTPYGIKTYSKSNPLIIGGTSGKDTWKSAVNVMQRETPGRVDKEVEQILRRIF